MFVDVTEFREKMGLLMRHYGELTEEERDVLKRALKVYGEMEELLSKFDEKTERTLVRSPSPPRCP